MKSLWLFSFAVVIALAVVIWQTLPTPSVRAQDMHMNLPPGVTVKVLKTLDSQGMPGVKKVTFSRLEIKPGAKWPNVVQPAKTWEYCYALAGEFTVKGPDGKTSVVKAGTPFTVPAGTKIPEVSNHGKQTAVDIFWEIEME